MTGTPALAITPGRATALKGLGLVLVGIFALLLPVIAPDPATTGMAVFTVMYVGHEGHDEAVGTVAVVLVHYYWVVLR